MQETRVRSVDQTDLLEEEMATHSSILAWRIPWTEESGGLQSMGSQRAGHDWAQPSAVGILSTGCLQGNSDLAFETAYGWCATENRLAGWPGPVMPVVPGCDSRWRHRTGVRKAQPQTKLGLLLTFINKLVLEQSHGPLATHHLWQLLLYSGRIESFWHIPQGHKAFYSLALCSKLNPSDTDEVGKHLFFSPSSSVG